MYEKSTDELENILEKTRPERFGEFLKENGAEIAGMEKSFAEYFKEKAKEHGFLLQDVFLRGDIPEKYGYKLISGEKHTNQRDTILRMCFGADLTLDETQHVLKLYGMPALYARIPRDAFLMSCFNNKPDSIIEANMLLHKNRMDTIRSCGTQD